MWIVAPCESWSPCVAEVAGMQACRGMAQAYGFKRQDSISEVFIVEFGILSIVTFCPITDKTILDLIITLFLKPTMDTGQHHKWFEYKFIDCISFSSLTSYT